MKKNNWEKEFDKQFSYENDEDFERDFIKQFIKSQKELSVKEILDKIENLTIYTFQPTGGISNIKYIQLSDLNNLKKSITNEK